MSTPEAPQEPEKRPPDSSGGKGDIIALGIGCLVFVIMFVAVVLVGMRER